MKKICKVILAAAAVVALAVPAMAADKLIVKDAAGTADVFKVDDAGTILGAKLGMGTSTPQAPIHLNLDSTKPVGTLLYNASTGLAVSRSGGAPAADFTAAATVAGQRGQMRGVRARGTLEVPAVPILNDYVFSLLAGVYVGPTIKVLNMADISYKVDGTVTEGATSALSTAPVRITFSTRVADTWFERFTVKAAGNIGINTPDPKSILHVTGLNTYADNATAKTALGGAAAVGAFYTDGVGNVKVVY